VDCRFVDGLIKKRRKNMRLSILVGLFAVGLVALIVGCKDPATETPEQKIARLSAIIRISAQSVTATGLVAVPNQQEANEIAVKANEVLDNSVFPLFKGEEQAIGYTVEKLLKLPFFDNDPRLAKLKAILILNMDIIKNSIPPDLLDKGLDKLPAATRAYLNAFFTGVDLGLSAYLGDQRVKGTNPWSDLRVTLSK
jgi:hypothetical protein